MAVSPVLGRKNEKAKHGLPIFQGHLGYFGDRMAEQPRAGSLGERVKPCVDRRRALEGRLRSAQHPSRKQLRPRPALQRHVFSARKPEARGCVARDCSETVG